MIPIKFIGLNHQERFGFLGQFNTSVLLMLIFTLFAFETAQAKFSSTENDLAETTSEVKSGSPELQIPDSVIYTEEVYLEAKATRRSKSGVKKPQDWRDADSCREVYDQVLEILDGNAERTECYMGLFYMETTCDHSESQSAGNAGNPHAAFGICSLEASPSVREDNGRGADCVNIRSLENQVKCCRAIMRRSPRYFGPYRRGEVGQCG